jgi:hypothetical protein
VTPFPPASFALWHRALDHTLLVQTGRIIADTWLEEYPHFLWCAYLSGWPAQTVALALAEPVARWCPVATVARGWADALHAGGNRLY